MTSPLTLKDLREHPDAYECDCGCNSGQFVMTARCHMNGGIRAILSLQEGLVTLFCRVCGNTISAIKVAEE